MIYIAVIKSSHGPSVFHALPKKAEEEVIFMIQKKISISGPPFDFFAKHTVYYSYFQHQSTLNSFLFLFLHITGKHSKNAEWPFVLLTRAIFQSFWRLHCCAKFLFFELETLNFGSRYVFFKPVKMAGSVFT